MSMNKTCLGLLQFSPQKISVSSRMRTIAPAPISLGSKEVKGGLVDELPIESFSLATIGSPSRSNDFHTNEKSSFDIMVKGSEDETSSLKTKNQSLVEEEGNGKRNPLPAPILEIDNEDNNDNIIDSIHKMPRRTSISSTTSNPSGSRRVIFRTLYESQNQHSPLCKNQDRQSQFDIPQSKTTLPLEISMDPKRSVQNHIINTISVSEDSLINTSTLSTDKSVFSYDEIIESDTKLDSDLGPTSSIDSTSTLEKEIDPTRDDSISPTSIITKKNDEINTGNNPKLNLQSILRNNQERLLEHEDVHKKIHHNNESLPPRPRHITFKSGNKGLNLASKVDLDHQTNQMQIRHLSRRNSFPKSSSDSCLNSFKSQIELVNFSVPFDVPEFEPTSTQRPRKTNYIKDSIALRADSTQNLKAVNFNKPEKSHDVPNHNITRHISHEEIEPIKKTIRFDPRIWVHEIQCPPVERMWYNASDMNRFKHEAILRIRKWTSRNHDCPNMLSTGTGRIVSMPRSSSHGQLSSNRSSTLSNKVMYTNPALSCEAEEDDEDVASLARILSLRETALIHEFKSVLIVDSHDIFLRLFSKGIKLMLPHAKISTACTIDDAFEEIKKANSSMKGSKTDKYSHGFDLIVIEERLKPNLHTKSKTSVHGLSQWNGSSLIAMVTKQINESSFTDKHILRHPLLVGVSAYLDNDKERLVASGSDFVWGKPPPKMNDELRLCLLKKIMLKRHRRNVDDLFQ